MKAPLIGRISKYSVILCKLEVTQEGLDRQVANFPIHPQCVPRSIVQPVVMS